MKHLSTSMTIVYKILALLFTLAIFTLTVFFIIDTHQVLGILIMLMAIPSLLVLNVYHVSYDHQTIYIRKWFSTETFEFSNVKSIYDADPFSLDPFFQLEIVDDEGELRKLNFIPDMVEAYHFYFTRRYVGHLLDFARRWQLEREV